METIKIIKIRKLKREDLKNIKKFVNYFNSLVKEDAPILFNKKVNSKAMKNILQKDVKEIERKKRIIVVAEDKVSGKIIGICNISLGKFRENHIANIAISVEKNFRGKGIGKALMEKALENAKSLKPKPKIFMLGVIPTNNIAIKLYKKLGFKKVAMIPNKIQYKGKLVPEIIMMKKA